MASYRSCMDDVYDESARATSMVIVDAISTVILFISNTVLDNALRFFIQSGSSHRFLHTIVYNWKGEVRSVYYTSEHITVVTPCADTMSSLLWTVSVLFLVDDSKAAPPPYVTLDPDWRTIFVGDKVSLTCNVLDPTGWENKDFYWYKDDQLIQISKTSLNINRAEQRHSGKYQCKTPTSDRSGPFRLDVSNDWLILQAPSHIYEGEALRLRCRGWNSLFSTEVKIYKDDKIIGNPIYPIDKTKTGEYKCTRTWIMSYSSKGVYLQVHDLFSVPVLGLTPPPLSEGDVMTLSCDTTLVPQRRTTMLQFAFYKNEQKIQDFSVNNKYRVRSAQLEHSGKYSCEVKTWSDSVRKVSAAADIPVQEILKPPVLTVFPSSAVSIGDQVVLRCATSSPSGIRLLYSFFRGSRTVRDYSASDTYTIPGAEEHHGGMYRCSGKSDNNKGLKFSKDINIVVKEPFDTGGNGKKNIEGDVAVGRPRLTLLPDKVAVGDEIILRCESSQGSPPIHYRFYHNGTMVGNVTVHQSRTGEIRQVIESVTRTGPYHCESRQDISPVIWLSGAISLFIVDPVADISVTIENDDEDFTFGEPVTFTCSVQRGTSPSYLWFHNGEVVEERSMFYQLRDNWRQLYIGSLQSHHTGTYRCQASNTLPPSRTFSVLSDPWDINVMEPSTAENNVLLTLLGIVLLTVLTAVLGLMYRQKMASIYRRCAGQQLKMERTKDEVRSTQNPTRDICQSSLDIGQEDYTNIPSRNHVVCEEDVGYSQIAFIRVKEASPRSNKDNEELSVTYSAVQFSQPTTDPRPTNGRPDCVDLYQNLNTERLQS
ncbi:Fc receptor-like protein 3 [Hyla sarda]|uniref:Fc receptor-like protein 3 n=1 Tax=Hyla sarda TaxID=327740 RepID=UPI0024C426FF|nr:Fc receptor-like protein 3 [Hyla sarda]